MSTVAPPKQFPVERVVSPMQSRVYPRFTSHSLRSLEGYQRRLSERILDLLGVRLSSERRELITDEDVRECMGQAMREMSREIQQREPAEAQR
jgi:hypothetical protein